MECNKSQEYLKWSTHFSILTVLLFILSELHYWEKAESCIHKSSALFICNSSQIFQNILDPFDIVSLKNKLKNATKIYPGNKK